MARCDYKAVRLKGWHSLVMTGCLSGFATGFGWSNDVARLVKWKNLGVGLALLSRELRRVARSGVL